MEQVFLALGSNMGDRRGNLEYALEHLRTVLSGLRVSRFYDTDPMYVMNQAPFMNAAVEGFTDMEPEALLDRVQAIETGAGRNRESALRRGPRILDIDILLFGDRRIQTPRLTCPHPLMTERLFVLVPLLELCPDCTEPGTCIHYEDYRKALSESGQGIRPAGE